MEPNDDAWSLHLSEDSDSEGSTRDDNKRQTEEVVNVETSRSPAPLALADPQTELDNHYDYHGKLYIF